MRQLHVAALPYPSRQGTQVCLHALCSGLARRGHELHLLVHAHGAFPLGPTPYAVHRLPDRPRVRSLRSGPSWGRVALDLVLVVELARWVTRLRPDLVVLHNVEAGAAGLAAPRGGEGRRIYVAHNLMEYELPSFAPPGRGAAARYFGGLLDRALPAAADGTVAVSEGTRRGLLARGADPGRVATAEPGLDGEDWPGAPEEPAGREDPVPVREGFSVAWLGNLDPYQGFPVYLAGLAALRRRGVDARARLITAADAGPALAEAARRGIPAEAIPHRGMAAVGRVLAGCAAAALTRAVPGGFPMKLPVLLAAGVPVAALPAAVEGIAPAIRPVTATGPSGEALAEALLRATGPGSAERSARLAETARTAYSAAAGAERFLAAVEAVGSSG